MIEVFIKNDLVKSALHLTTVRFLRTDKDSQLVGYIEDDQSESNGLEVFLKNEPSI